MPIFPLTVLKRQKRCRRRPSSISSYSGTLGARGAEPFLRAIPDEQLCIPPCIPAEKLRALMCRFVPQFNRPRSLMFPWCGGIPCRIVPLPSTPCASSVRTATSEWGSRGRGFESRRPDHLKPRLVKDSRALASFAWKASQYTQAIQNSRRSPFAGQRAAVSALCGFMHLR